MEEAKATWVFLVGGGCFVAVTMNVKELSRI
jgi:hypothetical protein